ncbi:iron-sulfur cluster assembly protein 1-like [Solanum pennellii]|uniref:Iron-sulfur cluster assembly protein 1-like n=1 Tax=Solanum pennellii TaxID=28526 RepID=A0ABM1G9U9_SOLPN|nr:iron-sulfur cluster assembly protein 1-like [Solanum pennellii]
MLKQIVNRVSGVSTVNLWRWRQLYYYNDHRDVGKGVVGAPVCEDMMKPQIKVEISDKMRKWMEDYFKGGVPCISLVAYNPNAKTIIDGKTGKIVVGEDRKPFFHRPSVRLPYCRILDGPITTALKDHEVKKTNLSDHSKTAVDA